MTHCRILASLILAAALTACSSGDGSSNNAPPAAPAQIGSGNAEIVASRATNAAFESGGFADLAGATGLTAVAAPGGLSKPMTYVAPAQVPVGPETSDCDAGGTITISGDIENPVTITPGDYIDIEWQDCDDGLGVIIDGLLGMTFTDFEGDFVAGQALLGIGLDIGSLRVSDGNGFGEVDGDVALTVDSLSPPLTTATSTGSALAISSHVGSETLSNFSSVVVEDGSSFPSAVTTEASGTVSSSRFQGSVSYTTPVPFRAVAGAYPYAGELLITGAGGATLRVIALDEVNVRIECDFDGDGAVDETIDTTWDALID